MNETAVKALETNQRARHAHLQSLPHNGYSCCFTSVTNEVKRGMSFNQVVSILERKEVEVQK